VGENMGVSKTTAFLLQELSRKGLFGGSLLQLGVQRISPDAKAMVKTFSAQHGTDNIFESPASKKQFWHNLGFEFVSSLDYSDFEGAELVWDLNVPLSDSFPERFDVVFDGGTMEHVFKTGCVMENIGRLLKVGGLAIHEVPCSNNIDHGFYSFSPTLFRDYYSAIGYEIVEIFLIEKNRHRAKVYEYYPRDINTEIPENWGKRSINVWCVARKRLDTVQDDAPQQTKYVNAWSELDHASSVNSGFRSNISILKRKIRTLAFVLSKKSAVFAVVGATFRMVKRTKNPLTVKYVIRAKRNGDYV
jgi:SAM-dependent methyltransferase